jgi:Fic family protein
MIERREILPTYKLAFIRESSHIERESERRGDREALEMAIEEPIESLEDILYLHRLLADGKSFAGKLRTVQVYVGGHVPPSPENVPRAMEKFIDMYPVMDSWRAHNEFEKIHPFQDYNGRVGRVIWASKAVHEEGYDLSLGFLHKYYYQTLNHYRSRT